MNLVRSLFVFVSVMLDYALMLAAMTFNTGIFFSVVVGLTLWSLLFAHTSVPLEMQNACTFTASSSPPEEPAVGVRDPRRSEIKVSRHHVMNFDSSCCGYM